MHELSQGHVDVERLIVGITQRWQTAKQEKFVEQCFSSQSPSSNKPLLSPRYSSNLYFWFLVITTHTLFKFFVIRLSSVADSRVSWRVWLRSYTNFFVTSSSPRNSSCRKTTKSSCALCDKCMRTCIELLLIIKTTS